MAKSSPSETTRRESLRGSAPFILAGLSGGHGIFHWFSQSFFVMLPEVVATFGLSGLQVGAIATTREVVSGIIALPGGVVTDMVRRQWGAVLTGCMATAALSMRFVDRRGFALSIHGVGGNVGDVVGPALTGVLLLSLSWQGILSIYAVVPLLLTFMVFWAFREIGHTGSRDAQVTGFQEQISNTRV